MFPLQRNGASRAARRLTITRRLTIAIRLTIARRTDLERSPRHLMRQTLPVTIRQHPLFHATDHRTAVA